MPSIYTTDAFCSDIPFLKILSTLLQTPLQIHTIAPKYSSLTLIDPTTSLQLNQPLSIAYYLCENSSSSYKLQGTSFESQIEVYEWLEYFNVQIRPLLNEIHGQIYGKIDRNEQKYNYAVEEIKRVFKVLDDRLKMRTFFVGDSLTIVDVVYAAHFQTLFKIVFTNDVRKKYTNLCRWFNFLRSLQPFTHNLGKMYLCENAFKIDFEAQTDKKEQAQEPNQDKKQKKQEKQTKPKKVEQKSQKTEKAEKVEKIEKTEKVEKSESVEQKQPQDSFNLDSFKRAFQNTQDKASVIDNLFVELTQNWSVYKIYYSKDVTQGKVDYLTCNLAKGTLQRLQTLRKIGFGTWGVYYSDETKQYEIRGVMLWKGKDIATAWKEHPSHEYHIFHKLNVKDASDQQTIKDYWLESQKCQGLILHASYKLI